MRAVVRTAEPSQTRHDAQGAAPRRTRVVLRRIDPWSVLKFSLLFYFCLMLVFVFALMILYWIMGLTGVLNSASHLLESVGFKPTNGIFDAITVEIVGVGKVSRLPLAAPQQLQIVVEHPERVVTILQQ